MPYPRPVKCPENNYLLGCWYIPGPRLIDVPAVHHYQKRDVPDDWDPQQIE